MLAFFVRATQGSDPRAKMSSDSYPVVKMERVDVPELVGDFLASLRTWISSGDVDLSAGLSLSKKTLESLGSPLALLLEHGVVKECGPTSYKLPTPLVSHLRAACRAHGRIDVERPKTDLSADLAELCERLRAEQSSKAALEPSTLIKGVAPTQRRQLRRLHPVPAARVIAPTLPGYAGDLPLLHDWSAAAVGLEGKQPVLTCTPCRSRAARAVPARPPAACHARPRHRAACPGALRVGTRPRERTVLTAYRGTRRAAPRGD